MCPTRRRCGTRTVLFERRQQSASGEVSQSHQPVTPDGRPRELLSAKSEPADMMLVTHLDPGPRASTRTSWRTTDRAEHGVGDQEKEQETGGFVSILFSMYV